ncbi:MAG: serine/threonine protein kinase, partial [Candidatus Margulisbacteria bacterium]|nr:serine/threonine protein kinase [Candidatus Margulisiibacteriota bacterium]
TNKCDIIAFMERFLKSRYKIGEKISENPFSVTYQGAFLGSNKPVIIKIYKRGTLNSLLINRMKQKVKELSLLSHHGIVKLVDGDYGWQGFYYVREFVNGQSLQQLLDSGQEFGVEKALTIVEEVCRALEPVHAKGIVHGALKPSNIFLNGQGVVKVADFVIEGEIKEAQPQKALAIMDDGRYASPEEIAGRPASASSDIYALGLILLELLTGKAFLTEKGLSASLRKLKGAPLPDREKLELLPRYLQDIIGKAMQTDPLCRFHSINELLQSLENKNLAARSAPNEELATIFENTVTQYGAEDVTKESEAISDLSRVNIRWGKEKHRNWILAVVLMAALMSGLVYAFLFGR